MYSLVRGQEELPKDYLESIKEAETSYQAGDYKKSAFAYSLAFKTLGWKGTANDRWNAACSWSLARFPDSAFFNLFRLASKMQFTDINRLRIDSDLNFLHSDKRWTKLLDIVQKNKDSAEANFNKPLVRQLDSIFIDDQKYRLELEDIERKNYLTQEQKSLAQQAIWELIATKDAINLTKVKTIIDKYGWLGPEEIGYQGNSTLFLVIQHSDQATQEKYLPIMREAAKKKKASPADLALLEDRVLLGQGKKQIYGSQITIDNRTGRHMLSPIEDEANVNKRRAAVGLQPIEDYVKHWGIEYKITTPIVNGQETHPTSNAYWTIVIFLSILLLSIATYFLINSRRKKQNQKNS